MTKPDFYIYRISGEIRTTRPVENCLVAVPENIDAAEFENYIEAAILAQYGEGRRSGAYLSKRSSSRVGSYTLEEA